MQGCNKGLTAFLVMSSPVVVKCDARAQLDLQSTACVALVGVHEARRLETVSFHQQAGSFALRLAATKLSHQTRLNFQDVQAKWAVSGNPSNLSNWFAFAENSHNRGFTMIRKLRWQQLLEIRVIDIKEKLYCRHLTTCNVLRRTMRHAGHTQAADDVLLCPPFPSNSKSIKSSRCLARVGKEGLVLRYSRRL